MRNGGSGLRYVGWALLIVIVVGIAMVVIAFKLGLAADQESFIDVNSGDVAQDKTFLGYTESHIVTATEFGNTARSFGLAKSDRDWRPIVKVGWPSGSKLDFPMHSADVACVGAMQRLRNEKTAEAKKKLLSQYVQLLRAGDEKGMERLSQTVGVEQENRVKAEEDKEGGNQ